MNIAIRNIWHRKRIVGEWAGTSGWKPRTPDPESNAIITRHIRCEFVGFQIKHKYSYKRRVDQGTKRYAVRVLLI